MKSQKRTRTDASRATPTSARKDLPLVPLALGLTMLALFPRTVHGDESPRTVRQAAQVLPELVSTLRSPSSPQVLIKGGSFRMGSTPDETLLAFAQCTRQPHVQNCTLEDYSDEAPVRRIKLSDFWIDRHEVSVARYKECVAVRRCPPIPYFRGASRFNQHNLPVTMVTWYDARRYCAFRRLSLPTEAQWARAARGRTGRLYPWGNLFNLRVANHGRHATDPSEPRDGYVELAPVGSYADGKTPDGIFDLAGNAAEWTLDRYLPKYDSSDLHDPKGPTPTQAEPDYVIRGGNYMSPPSEVRAAARDRGEPSTRHPGLGFRCVRSTRSARTTVR